MRRKPHFLQTEIGVLLGGILTASAGWRSIFFINAPTGLIIAIAIPLLLPAMRGGDRGRGLDVLGAALATAAMGSLVYGITRTGNGTVPASCAVPLGAAAALIGLFILRDRNAQAPLVGLRLLGRRPLQAGGFIMLVASGLMVGSFFLISFVLQHSLNWSPISAGTAFLPIAVSILAGAHLAGRVLAHLGPRRIALSAFLVAATGFAIAATQVETPLLLIASISLASLGLGAAFVSATTTALSQTSHGEAGSLSSVVNVFHELGGAIGVAALSATAAPSLSDAQDHVGFTAAFVVAATIGSLSAIAAWVLVSSFGRHVRYPRIHSLSRPDDRSGGCFPVAMN